MTKKRPFGVTVLAILTAVAAIIAIFHTLQMLHLFPIRGPFGFFAFFTFDLLGAILWGILALIWIWVTRRLWNLDPQGWMFVAVLSTLNLILALLSILGRSTLQAMLPSIIVNGLILLYTLMPSTKEAFGISTAPVEESTLEAEPEPEMDMSQQEPAVEEAVRMAGTEFSEPPPEGMEGESGIPSKTTVTGAAASSHDLSYIEGIGETYSGKLNEAGVDSPQALLERGATPTGRKELAEATEISEHLILKWVNHADLYRISGIGSEYADLLEAAGVDTVLELAQRNPANLFEKLTEVNAEKALVRKLPTTAQVEDWVTQAKSLPRMISY